MVKPFRSISIKIALPAIITAVALVLTFAYTVSLYLNLEERISATITQTEKTMMLSSRLLIVKKDIELGINLFLVRKNPVFAAKNRVNEQEFETIAKRLQKLHTSPTALVLQQELLQTWRDLSQLTKELEENVNNGQDKKIKRTFRRWSLLSIKAQSQIEDYTVANFRYIEEVNAQIQELAQGYIFSGLVLIALMLTCVTGLFLFLKKSIIFPIQLLTRTATGIAVGDYEKAPPRIVRNDEIGLLSSAFSSMALNLISFNRGLESEVQQRTSELANANALLKKEILERQRSEAQLEMIINSVPAGISYFDRSLRFVFANKKYQDLVGLPPNELPGMHLQEVIGNTSYRKAEPHVLQALNGKATSFDNQLPGHDASLFFEVSYLPHLDSDGTVTGFCAMVHDISLRKRQEASLLDAKLRAESADEAKSRFLSQMSHEIRTPMNGVIGCVDMLARSSLKPHQVELVETMHDSSLALLTVIDDILDFSKIEAGQLELEREPVSLEQVVESACATMKQIALRKRLKIDLFIHPRLPHLILSDSVRLRQIINNLLSNAIKFTRNQNCSGRIMVRVESASESLVRISVTDNGIGISAEGQAKLFKPFMQAESSTTRRYGGTGLGLSICKQLVDMLGGHIEVDSQVGCGSTFLVTLPIEPVTAPSPPVDPDLSGLHCLIVVRDMEQARDWCVYLEHAGACSEPIAEQEMVQRRLAQLPPETTVVVMEGASKAVRQWLDGLLIDSKPTLVVMTHDNEQIPHQLGAGIAEINGDLISRSALLQAIGIATGRIQPQSIDDVSSEHLSKMLTPLDRELAIKQNRLILVAEDNAINQKMISRQLTLLGYAADVIDNGRDALYAWREGCHALLLTDLHMPAMDGYELTRAIRNEESGTEHLPIIAITANAFIEEADKCLAVGMDEYLSKPIVLDKLKASLGKLLPEIDMDATPALADITVQSAEIPDKKPLDTAVLANLVGDDPTLIEEFFQDYRQSIEEAAMQIKAALRANEHEVVRDVAHRLKSSSRAVGALSLGECCEQIEQSTNAGDPMLHKEFESILNDVIAEIDKIVKLPC
ncbi:ATP-binding protein [Amphritea sp. HPY]|uniref:ATP-binding protein n=1 Tax=Amphritea sp. HPY TaxID=3421652 RepID=UPI003D7D5420